MQPRKEQAKSQPLGNRELVHHLAPSQAGTCMYTSRKPTKERHGNKGLC